nr:hypothetical protein [Tanacetum cinerariifolium]
VRLSQYLCDCLDRMGTPTQYLFSYWSGWVRLPCDAKVVYIYIHRHIALFSNVERLAQLLGIDIESEPFEGEAKEPESLHFIAPPTCRVVELEASGTFGVRPTSPSPNLLDRKRYKGTSKLILSTDIEGDEEVEESLDSDSEYEDAEDEGPTVEDEDLTAGDEGLTMWDEGHGMGVKSLGLDDESHGLDNEGHSMESDGFGLGKEDEAKPKDQQQAVTVVGTVKPPSPEWPSGLFPISPTPSIVPSPMMSLTIPSPIASHVATPKDTIPVDEDQFKEIDRDVKELYTRSRAVRDEIFSQRYRFRSLEHKQERTAMTFGALWRLVLELKRELHEMRGRVIALEHERDRKERGVRLSSIYVIVWIRWVSLPNICVVIGADGYAYPGLVPNTISRQPCIPPNMDDRDHLFQLMFNEYFTPLAIAVAPVKEASALRVVDFAYSPVSTLFDHDASSLSTPSTQEQE